MLSDLYSDDLLDAASTIPAERRLDDADASSKKISRVCGSEIEVDIKLDNGVVADFGLSARACALGQAAASLVARSIVGATPAALRRLRDEMRLMLKEGAPPPADERWIDLAKLQGIRDYPQRHASTLLVFDAIVDCLDKIDETEAVAP